MTRNPSLILQMLKPDFYDHPVAAAIKLIQTHASYILLTGKYAYKVKKPVNFGFLDYSTFAKRKYFIEQEFRLNQKIAPQLYLKVLPISQQNSSFVLDDNRNIVEYTLKMRQFDQENLFSNLLTAGKLSESLLIELGKIIAHLHQNAETNEYISSFGRVEQIKLAFTENYQQSQPYIGSLQTPEQFQATKAYTDFFFAQRQDLFQARIDNHHIKEGHGDLHLNNICLWQDKIQLFDRIEFNESFRYVDTIYDIAFTVMDLEARNHPELGNAFLNSYLELTGDWVGLLLLPLYLSRQAYVRAKVNSFLLDNSEISPSEQNSAQQAAQNYYHQAYQYTQRPSGSLILMSGLSGSGKSTVAKTIARKRGGIQIRSDAVRKHLAGISLEQKAKDNISIYTSEMSQKTYDRLLELGILLAQEGYLVILDAKYDRCADRHRAISQAQKHKIPLHIIHCVAPLNVLRDRLHHRHHDISDATADLLPSQQKNAEPFTPAEQVYLTTVDTSQANWQQQLFL